MPVRGGDGAGEEYDHCQGHHPRHCVSLSGEVECRKTDRYGVRKGAACVRFPTGFPGHHIVNEVERRAKTFPDPRAGPVEGGVAADGPIRTDIVGVRIPGGRLARGGRSPGAAALPGEPAAARRGIRSHRNGAGYRLACGHGLVGRRLRRRGGPLRHPPRGDAVVGRVAACRSRGHAGGGALVRCALRVGRARAPRGGARGAGPALQPADRRGAR